MDDDGVGTLWEGACNLRTFCAPTSTSALGAPQRRCCNCGGIAAYELSPSPKAAHHRVGSTQPLGTLGIEGGCEVPTGG